LGIDFSGVKNFSKKRSKKFFACGGLGGFFGNPIIGLFHGIRVKYVDIQNTKHTPGKKKGEKGGRKRERFYTFA
jgi:hypothetical protein